MMWAQYRNSIIMTCAPEKFISDYYRASTVPYIELDEGVWIRKHGPRYYLERRTGRGNVIQTIPRWTVKLLLYPKTTIQICPLVFAYGFEDAPEARRLLTLSRKLMLPHREYDELQKLMNKNKLFVKWDVMAVEMIKIHLKQYNKVANGEFMTEVYK